jgi:hypothetical protein
MAASRRRALEVFPQLRHHLQRRGYSVYQLFFDLLPMSREAHDINDSEALGRIYGFADWCFRQREKGLWNPAGVAFYEQVFDVAEEKWPDILPWIPSDVERDCWTLWNLRLGPAKEARLRKLFAQRNTSSERTNWHGVRPYSPNSSDYKFVWIPP